MHPVFVTEIAAAQRQDKLARAAAARQARSARQARRDSQPEATPRHPVWYPHRLAVPGTRARQKAGA